ncbi:MULTISPECIES: TIGR02757 family protein [Tenacibaculum]|uniref:TIGR02757 family protein n=1 Tax=Tenacibaculum TaxID=104267 RepID=UPI001F0AE8ED|nr:MULTISPECIES: TIGR02757 family protein [Tenacibaculum]MCH3882999.1 TIGR02757 family protein [Tenacibaculum aquimarinum]MDO6601041.1 TIGR02757 family protein [Tenacibaculum sp. 1_MG-2023]
MTNKELQEFLDEKVIQYNNPKFIESDPIQIPHLFSKKEDIEIAGFLTATIAWGKRQMIINNSNKMMELLDHSPHDFVVNHTEKELSKLTNFVHRTFNEIDFQFFIKSLKNIYKNHNGLENALLITDKSDNYKTAIHNFKKVFFEIPHQSRTTKHVSDPLKNSASKRINMYLRWMVRDNKTGVDFGIWKNHDAANLHCPLDVHSGNVARKLTVLTRKQNDWKAVREMDTTLRKLDKKDPSKYDFALFGLGVFEQF